jgi:hypothetical protein
MSEYYMMESWGLKHGEPTQKPLSVDFDDWADDYGLDELQVDFLLGWRLKDLGLPDPIQMTWKEEIAGGGVVWEMEGTPSQGPRSAQGVRRKWAYKASDPPLFHKELVAALQECGVDNLEVFPVRITDTRTGEVCDDYLAVNFVGLVKAADMGTSQATPHSPDELIDTDFDSVTINEGAAKGFKMFRLAESVNALVVHRSIKEHLESKGGFELTFTEPEDWVG